MNFLDGLKKLLGGAVNPIQQGAKAGMDFASMLRRPQQQAQPQQQVPELQRRVMLNDAIGMPYGDYTVKPQMGRGAYNPRQQGAPFIPRPAEDDAMVWGPRGAQPLNTIQRNQPWQRMNDQPFDPYEYY